MAEWHSQEVVPDKPSSGHENIVLESPLLNILFLAEPQDSAKSETPGHVVSLDSS